MMKNHKRTVLLLPALVFLLPIFLSSVFFSCASAPPSIDRYDRTEGSSLEKPEGAIAPETGMPAPPAENYLTIIAVGDNLYHEVMIKEGEEGDYEAAYSEIRPLVEKADIAFINQETLLAGEDFGFSGYPRFNSPRKLGQALLAAGFNVVNHASNHIMDKGEAAVTATLDFWDSDGQVTVLGIHRSEEERGLPKITEKNNIRLGFLSYTYGTNGLPLPKDKTYLVSLINTEIMAKEIDAIRPLCDILVVSMHWGEEYRHDCSEDQKKLAAFLAERCVDLIIGHHPHVIQPIEYIKRPDGKETLCFYSLGNFISAQTQNPTLLGAMAYIKIKKNPARPGVESDTCALVEAGAIPLVTHYEKDFSELRVYPLYAYTEELIKKHRKNQSGLTLDYLENLAEKILGEKEMRHDPFD